MSGATYRFRFYGRRPADWSEGANLGHGYEIAFRHEPRADQKAALARLAEERFAQGPCELSSEPWLWSRHVASFTVAERWHNAAPMVFSRVTDFLVAAHEIAPLAQAIFCGVREEGGGRWDTWTRQTAPVPDPGPPYDPPRTLPFGRPIDPDLPEAAPDEIFEAIRSTARAFVAEARAEQATRQALATCSKSGLRLIAHDGPAPTAGAIEDPRFGTPPEGSQWHIRPGPPRNALILDAKTNRGIGLAMLDDADEPHMVEGIAGHATEPALSVDGLRGIVACAPNPHTRPQGVYLLDTSTFTLRPLWTAEDDVEAVGRLTDGSWLVATAAKLVVLDGQNDEAPSVIATLKYKGVGMVVAYGGTGFAMTAWPHVDVFGYCLGKLKKLGRLSKVQVQQLANVDDQIVGSVGESAVALSGFEQAYEAWARPMRDKQEARRQKALRGVPTKAAKLALEPTDEEVVETDGFLWPSEVAAEDFAPQFAELEEPELYQSRSSGRVVAVDMGEVTGTPKKGVAAWVGSDGQLHTRPVEIYRSMVRFTPDGLGAAVFDTRSSTVLLVDLESDQVQRLEMTGPVRSVDDLLLLDQDRIVGIHHKGLVLWCRDAAAWSHHEVKLSKCQAAAWCPALEVLAVRSEATKARLVLYAVAEDQLVRLGAFSERVNGIAVDGDSIRLHTVEGDRFVVQNVAAVAEQKRAQALAKAKKS